MHHLGALGRVGARRLLYQASPPLLFDYYGFPKAAYEIQYPAPCDLKLADKVVALLKAAGGFEEVKLDKTRGYDHGVFVPLTIAAPKADIAVIQVSLCKVTEDRRHTAMRNLRLGAVLGELRDAGVMLIGSGMSYHNMRGFGDARSKRKSARFNAWLVDTMTMKTAKQSIVKMMSWMDAPNALDCHPREEHLLPLHVCLGTNIGVGDMDELLAEYAEHGKGQVANDAGERMKVDVQMHADKIIVYSGFVFL